MRELADTLAGSRPLRDSIVHRSYLPGEAPSWADLPAAGAGAFDPTVMLAAAGIERLYSHQAEALTRVRGGRDVLTVTPTASGKSLIYIIPTLDAAAIDPTAKALWIFPYKALEQDQHQALTSFITSAGLAGRVNTAIYDGDTPPRVRKQIKAEPPSVLITNPDMLHLGFLAYHDEWRDFFTNLKYIVVDELHVYRGIFGSHFHHVMKRLARICARYGSSPRFIVSSATIGNPGEFAGTLLGRDFAVVDHSGAPRAGRHFLFLNPGSGSPYTAATWVLEQCVRAGYRTLVFTKARKITELLTSWVSGTAPDLASRIASYRAGYLAKERRMIESRLASGDLLGVISTSALEHGIDVGGLDVCVLVGYPGSITSSWQRIGRVGRSGREALVVLVALPDALDQYFMTQPAQFFERGYERAAADPGNVEIASRHLVCAGAEIPLTDADRKFYPEATFSLIPRLARSGGLVEDATGTSWYSLRRHPQRDVNLRSLGASYMIINDATGRNIGTVDGVRAFTECHEGAIYLHQGRQFEVLELDRERRRVRVQEVRRDYYTQVMSEKETEVLEVHASREAPGYRASLGRLRVTQEFKEYVRKRVSDQQKISSHPLDLPPLVYETIGLWWEIPDAVREEATNRQHHFMGSIHASEHAAISLFPLLTICDRNDIGGISYPAHPQTTKSTVFIYDGFPGGIGLAAQGFERIEMLLEKTRKLVSGCSCEIGCPSCIHSPKCGSGNHPLDKAGAGFVLEQLVRDGGRTRPVEARQLPPPPPPPAETVPLGAPPPAVTKRKPAFSPSRREEAGSRVLFFDLETRRSAEEVGGWGNIRELGLALAVVYDELKDEFRTYLEQDIDRLIVDLMSADRVIGFNIKRFDYTVLGGYRDAAFHRIPTCDMLEEIHLRLGFRIKLQHLAEITLGEGKSADGLQSLEWFKQGRLDLIEEYCRKDVEVTRRLYHYGREHGYLLYHDYQQRAMRVAVDW